MFLCYEIIGYLSFRLIGHFVGRILVFRGSLISFGLNLYGDILLMLCLVRILLIFYVDITKKSRFFRFILIGFMTKSIVLFSFL